MFNLGGWEIAVLAIAGLVFFGPNKLPQLMRQAGKIMREIKKASSEFQYSIERELDDDKYKRQHRREKKRKKKMKEMGLDPDAPVPPAPDAAATQAIPPTETPAGAVPVETDTAAPLNGDASKTNTGS